MAYFLLSKYVCSKINTFIWNFWWGGDGESTIFWKNWASCSKPKFDGGLGFKDCHLFNLAMLAKQCWRLISKPNSFWAHYIKTLYVPNSSFFNAKKGHNPSRVWMSLLAGKKLLEQRHGRIGYGRRWGMCTTNFFLFYFILYTANMGPNLELPRAKNVNPSRSLSP